MEERIKEVIRRIEFKVEMENRYWEKGEEKAAERKGNQIDGMLDALSILTGKRYEIENNKVVEI